MIRFIYFFFVLFALQVVAQNTVGTLKNELGSFDAYTLFTAQKNTYLINNCGQVVHQWQSDYNPGNAVYLLENGNLLRACDLNNPDITFGGTGGRIELRNWEGDLIWEYNYSSESFVQHHDIYPMPNGNILMLAVTVMDENEALQSGRDPDLLEDGRLYNEQILELEPKGTSEATIVWEWNIKDHLIQDFDSSKENFGTIEDHPELLDSNFIGTSGGQANWLHMNSMQYFKDYDQIILSSRLLNEIYIIDHSTSTEEASRHTGGNSGKGGDLLYRWGNPQAYNQGDAEDQVLFGQHYPNIIADGLNNQGKLILFNNGFGRDPSFSQVFILELPIISDGSYLYEPGSPFAPEEPFYSYVSSPDPTELYSGILSSAQVLPNGNTLICYGDTGNFIEIDANEKIVWEYVSPILRNGIASQGDTPAFNYVFRAIKFPLDYPAFSGRDLSPGDPIEMDFNLDNCSVLAVSNEILLDQIVMNNPVKETLNIKTSFIVEKIEVFNVQGQKVLVANNQKNVNFTSLSSGLYFIRIYTDQGLLTKKILKENI